MEAGREHARVLTGALALELRLGFQAKRDPGCLLGVGRWRHAAAQGILVEPDPGQHPRHTSLMSGCGVVRGTGEGQILGLKAEGIGSATCDERDGLKRFCRGPKIGDMLAIAVARQQSPADVGNDDDARVCALDELSASDFRQSG
jgi:hypothetical protein